MKPVTILVLALVFSATYAMSAHAGEVMTDRCSNEVSIPPTYDAKPNDVHALLLGRGRDGSTPWTKPFKVQLGDDGHVRWWCHSTTGNMFDLGTLRVTGANPSGILACVGALGTTIISSGSGAASLAACATVVNFGSSAWEGWTPERSRCSNHSTRIRARLGPDRLLQIECLGN